MTNDELKLLMLVWLNGALIGGLTTAVWIWFSLATGRRTFRKLAAARPDAKESQ